MFVKILELIPKLVFVSKQCTLEFFWTTNLVGLNPSGLPPSSQCKTCSTNFPCKNQTFVFSLCANWYFHLISQVFVVLVTVDFCHQFARLLAFSENWGQYGNFEVMLLKSEHKERGLGVGTQWNKVNFHKQWKQKKRILVFNSQIYFYPDYHWLCKVNWRQFIFTILKQNWKKIMKKERKDFTVRWSWTHDDSWRLRRLWDKFGLLMKILSASWKFSLWSAILF